MKIIINVALILINEKFFDAFDCPACNFGFDEMLVLLGMICVLENFRV
jgi:hypothetical protein